MNYHLVKTEPSTYSWERLEQERQCVWDGIRNFAARKNLRGMNIGDHVLVYHSGDQKSVVGIANVLKAAYPDPSAEGEEWDAVDLVPEKKLKRPVTLAEIKSEKRLASIYLIRQSRLSVMPLRQEEFELIVEMSNTN